jgi:hypothetical protein
VRLANGALAKACGTLALPKFKFVGAKFILVSKSHRFRPLGQFHPELVPRAEATGLVLVPLGHPHIGLSGNHFLVPNR